MFRHLQMRAVAIRGPMTSQRWIRQEEASSGVKISSRFLGVTPANSSVASPLTVRPMTARKAVTVA